MSADLFNLLVPSADRLLGSLGGPGIYYIVPAPPAATPRWELIAFSFEEYGDDSGHSELWLDHVTPIVASAWARSVRMKPGDLERVVEELDHAFPRGRITQKLEHLHGNDADSTGWSLDRIERRFGLDGKCRRSFDAHETCNQAQRDQACLLLSLSATWSAT